MGGKPDGVNLIEQKFLPFGEQLTNPTSMGKVAKGFTNHEQTDASGLIYMQARFYLPMYGRFASPDPARDQHFEETQSWNIYSYCQNDPVMRFDPTGMVDWGAWANRGIGLLKVAGGLAEMTAGAVVTAGTSGIGAVPGVLAIAHGADVGASGLKQLWTGKDESSLTSQGLQAAGMSKEMADTTDALVSFGNITNGVRVAASGLGLTTSEAPTGSASTGGAPSKTNAGRGKNRLKPDAAAEGPHSTFKRGADGKIINHAEYTPNSKNPSGYQEVKRVDVAGRAHTNPDGTVVPTPHVKEQGQRGVRPARSDELPR